MLAVPCADSKACSRTGTGQEPEEQIIRAYIAESLIYQALDIIRTEQETLISFRSDIRVFFHICDMYSFCSLFQSVKQCSEKQYS